MAVVAGILAGEAVTTAPTDPGVVLAESVEARLRAGQRDEAMAEIEQFLRHDPGNAAVRRLRERIAGSGAAATLDEAEAIRDQAALVEAGRLERQATLAADQGRIANAILFLELAAEAFHASARPADEERTRAACERMRRVLLDQHDDGQRQERSARLHTAIQSRDALQDHAARRFEERVRRIEALAAKDLVEAALADARSLVRDHPGSAEARRLQGRLIERSHQLRRLTDEEQREELLEEVRQQVHASLIPTTGHDADLYPLNWDERHGPAGLLLDEPPPERAEDARLRNTLLQRVDIAAVEQDGIEFLEQLARRCGFDVIIAPEQRARTGQITLTARSMPASKVLDWACRLLSLEWTTLHGAVHIGFRSTELVSTVAYDVGEILFQVHDQVPRWRPGLPQDDGNLTRAAMTSVQPEDQQSAIAPEDLVDLITNTIAPAFWRNHDRGISIRGTTLIVTAPASIHALVRQFLHGYHQTSRLMVAIEVRWLALSDRYLEEIGVSWTSAGSILTPIGADTSGLRSTSNHFDVAGGLVNTLPALATTPTVVGSGLSLSAQRLGTLPLSAMLKAIEHNERATLVDATELHTVAGAQAFAYFGRTVQYLGGIEVGAGAGDGATAVASSQINTLYLGSLIDVKPLVSADRRYVTLDVHAVRATLDGFMRENLGFTRSVPIATDPAANGGQGGPVTVDLTGAIPLELPQVTVDQAMTTVMIPDGGTLMVGGFGKYVEQTGSTRVPFLGHLPFLGRLFGERARSSDRRKITLLMTVDILDYAEKEAAR